MGTHGVCPPHNRSHQHQHHHRQQYHQLRCNPLQLCCGLNQHQLDHVVMLGTVVMVVMVATVVVMMAMMVATVMVMMAMMVMATVLWMKCRRRMLWCQHHRITRRHTCPSHRRRDEEGEEASEQANFVSRKRLKC